MKTTMKIGALAIAILAMASIALGGEWHIETVNSDGDGGKYSSIALDSDGFPCITYSKLGQLKYAHWNGTSWDNTDIFLGVYRSSMCVDSLDRIHIAFQDQNNDDTLTYLYWDGSTWEYSEIDDDVDGTVSIALDSADIPHISYRRYGLKYAYLDGSDWQISVVDDLASIIPFNSIAIDSDNNPHISYSNDSYHLKYAYWDGSEWNTSRVAAPTLVQAQNSIAIDSSNNPHIAFCEDFGGDSYGESYVYWDGSTWQKDIVDTNGEVGAYSSLALDSNDNPHIAYYDYDNSDIRYANHNGTMWEITTIESLSDYSGYTSLALDATDTPHISYYDKTNLNLKYAWYETIGIEDDDTPTIPTGFELSSAAPNPNDGSATISFALPSTCEIELALYDIKGRKVATLAEGTYQPGDYSADVSGLSSGVYIYELNADEFSNSKKMVVQ